MFTLEDFRREIKVATSGHGGISDEDAVRAINLAQERIVTGPTRWWELRRTHRFSLTVLSSAFDSYSLSTLALQGGDRLSIFRGLRIQREERIEQLKHIPEDSWPDHWDEQTGRPYYYTTWGDVLKVSPRVDETYEAQSRYYRYAPDLVNEADTSILVGKDNIIVAFAASHLLNSLGRIDAGSRWYTIADNQLRIAMENAVQNADEQYPAWVNEPHRAQSEWGYW